MSGGLLLAVAQVIPSVDAGQDLPVADTLAGIRRNGGTMLIVGVIIIGVIVLYAVLARSGEADEQADEMQAAMLQEKANAEAWERLTK